MQRRLRALWKKEPGPSGGKRAGRGGDPDRAGPARGLGGTVVGGRALRVSLGWRRHQTVVEGHSGTNQAGSGEAELSHHGEQVWPAPCLSVPHCDCECPRLLGPHPAQPAPCPHVWPYRQLQSPRPIAPPVPGGSAGSSGPRARTPSCPEAAGLSPKHELVPPLTQPSRVLLSSGQLGPGGAGAEVKAGAPPGVPCWGQQGLAPQPSPYTPSLLLGKRLRHGSGWGTKSLGKWV